MLSLTYYTILYFHISTDYIFILVGCSPFLSPEACDILAYAIVDEPSPVRSLAADYPIPSFCQTFALNLISCLCCSRKDSKDVPAIKGVCYIYCYI